MIIKATLDKFEYHIKPTKPETGIISKRIACNENITELEVDQFAEYLIQPYGYTWTPTIFKGNLRLNSEWKMQQLFGLDFDTGITLEEVIDRCNKYNIKPAFIYSTFSSVNNNKFRVIFINNHIVEDYRVGKLIQLALMNLFPESDKSCKDACRLYFGGKEIIYNDYEAIINVPELIEGLVHYFTDTMNNNYLKKIKTFCSDVGVDMINGYPKIIKEKVGESTSTPPLLLYTNRTCGTSVLFDYTIYFSRDNIKDNHTKDETDKPKKIKYNIDNEKVKRDKMLRRYKIM